MSNHLLVEAMIFACQISNRSDTSALNRSTLPLELWFGCRPYLDSIPTIGALGYLRDFRLEHKLTPRGANCILLGPAEGFPCETFRMSEVPFRQALTWHPPTSLAKIREPGCEIPATKYRRDARRRSAITRFTSQLGHLETTPRRSGKRGRYRRRRAR